MVKMTRWSSNRALEWGRNLFWWLCCWCLTGLSISETADLLGFSHTAISRVYREWSEKQKIFGEQQFSGVKCHVNVKGQTRMSRQLQADKKATQLVTAKVCRRASLNPQHLKPRSGWNTVTEGHTGWYSCKLRTGNKDYNLHRLANIGQYETRKVLSWFLLNMSYRGQGSAIARPSHTHTHMYVHHSFMVVSAPQDVSEQMPPWTSIEPNGVQPSTSKMHIIKWLVTVYIAVAQQLNDLYIWCTTEMAGGQTGKGVS